MTETQRTFTHFRRAWYAQGNYAVTLPDGALDDVFFGLSSPDGSRYSECVMRWYLVSGEPTARLEVFADAFAALFGMPDVLDAIADAGESLTPERFCALLVECDFADATPITAS